MYFNKIMDDQKQNSKETWKILNTIINKRHNESSYPDSFITGGITVSNTNDIADGFDHFFANIGKELADKIDPPANGHDSIHDYLEDKNKNSVFLIPTTEDEVIGIVKTCKDKTSTYSNYLSMSVIKKVIQPITLSLAAIFNMSFQTGVFPSNMKLAKIIPVFKSGSKAEFNNYRPISLLSQCSKIVEKLYNKRLEQFIDKNNVLYNSQYGFQSSMSTSHALIDLVEEISESVDTKVYTLGVFVDLKKAFDTVNHSTLLKKLNF